MLADEIFEDCIQKYTVPPTEDFSYLPPEKDNSDEDGEILSRLTTASLQDPAVRSRLETLMVRSLIGILESQKSSSSAILGAVKEIKDILGYGKAPIAPIVGENVQVNNIDQAQAKHLLEGLKSSRAVAIGTDSGTRPMAGGKGV